MKKIFFLLFVLFCLASCATRITVPVTRPAELDLNGAKTIAILPFQPNPWNNDVLNVLDFFLSPPKESYDKIRICDELTEKLTTTFVNSDYMAVISPSSVQNSLRTGRKMQCDVYLTGFIQNFDERIERCEREEVDHGKNDYKEVEKSKEKNLDRDRGPVRDFDRPKKIVEYRKNVSVTIVYEIIDSYSNRIIARRHKNLSGSSSYYKSKRDLPSAYDILRYDLSPLVTEIKRQIQPYTVNVTFKLLKDKTKDPEIRSAHEMAKNHRLTDAKDMFVEAYERTGNFECCYNAAIILTVLRKYDDAEDMMQNLYRETFDKRAEKALNDIRKEKFYSEKLNAQESARAGYDDEDDFYNDFYDYDYDDDFYDDDFYDDDFYDDDFYDAK